MAGHALEDIRRREGGYSNMQERRQEELRVNSITRKAAGTIMQRLAVGTAALALVLGSMLAQAQTPDAAAAIIPRPPQVAAASYILMDAKTGKVIVEENADEQLPPASLTKIMTAYIAEVEIDNGNMSLDDLVHISEKAWRTQGSKMFVDVNSQVRVEDILRGIIIQSGNDASVA